MTKLKISAVDKNMIKAYMTYNFKKYNSKPSEYEVSQLIDNLEHDHRYLVEKYIDALWKDLTLKADCQKLDSCLFL